MGVRSLSSASISTGAKRSKFWDQSTVLENNAYESIATIVGDGSSDTLTFSNIPSTYKNLQIRLVGRVTASTTVENVALFFNNDTGSNYSNAYAYGAGNGQNQAFAGYNTATTGIRTMGRIPGTSVTSSAFGLSIIDILDYSNTDKNKTASCLTGWENNGNGESWVGSGVWTNNTAINRIDLKQLFGSGGWTSTTTAALFGIKG